MTLPTRADQLGGIGSFVVGTGLDVYSAHVEAGIANRRGCSWVIPSNSMPRLSDNEHVAHVSVGVVSVSSVFAVSPQFSMVLSPLHSECPF